MNRETLTCVAGLVVVVVGLVLRFSPLPADEVLESQGLVAAAGAALLAWSAWSRGGHRDQLRRRVRDTGLVVLATLTAWLWLAPTGFQFERFLHGWDAFHYYVGGKYFRELGYYGLYDCTLLADVEAGFGSVVEGSLVRDLRTNEVKPASDVIRQRDACKQRFTAERWREFAHDVAFFRAQLPPARWLLLRTDHGYNPPPTWGLLGTLLANGAPASRAQVAALVALDPLLIVALSTAIAWAFGWRVLCVALLFLGNNYPANWDWIGGSMLRYDWLFLAVLGICLLRRQRPAAAGAALVWSAAIRIFPGTILAALALRRAGQMIPARRFALDPDDRRLLAASFATALALFVGASAVAGGVGAWWEFAQKSRIHLATPLVNHAGLAALLAYDHDEREAVLVEPAGSGDPYARWREERRATFAARAPLFWPLVAAYLALLAVAVRRHPAWIAAVLGAGSIAIVFELTGYYHAVLLVFAFLWPLWQGIGVALLALAAASRLVASIGLGRDEIFFWTNLMTVAVVVGATAWLARTDVAEHARSSEF